MTKTAQRTFAQRCQAIADDLGVGIDFFQDEKYQEPFVDDGTLHVVNRTGMRACFAIGEDASAADWNITARKILTALGLETKIGKRVLQEERTNDADEYCEHCGRGQY